MNRFRSMIRHQFDRIRRLFDLFKEKGVAAFLKRILSYTRELFYLRSDGYLLEMENPEIVFQLPNEISYVIEELKEPIDLSNFFVDLTRENVAFRMNNGEYGFIVKHLEKVVGTVWMTNNSTYFPGFEFRIVSRSKWLNTDSRVGFAYRGMVDSGYRGNRILIGLYNALIIKAKEIGVKKMVTSMGVHNIAARKQALRAGWKVVARVNCIRILGVCFRRLTTDDNCR